MIAIGFSSRVAGAPDMQFMGGRSVLGSGILRGRRRPIAAELPPVHRSMEK
jgi:hypothetical protein